MAGRYDYIPADSSAGVVLYDDKFAYSTTQQILQVGDCLMLLTLFASIDLVI